MAPGAMVRVTPLGMMTFWSTALTVSAPGLVGEDALVPVEGVVDKGGTGVITQDLAVGIEDNSLQVVEAVRELICVEGDGAQAAGFGGAKHGRDAIERGDLGRSRRRLSRKVVLGAVEHGIADSPIRL